MRFTLAALVFLASAVSIDAQAPQAPLPTFQTASIEPSTGGLIGVEFTPQRFTARTTTLAELIGEAYGLKPWEIFGGPDWMRTDRFTVRAASGVSVSREQMKLMLRTLLADRFQMQIAPETRTIAVYTLTTVDARKLARTSKPGKRPSIDAQDIQETGNYRWDSDNVSMDLLAATLSQHLRAPVVNATKLPGAYDFHLRFAQDDVFGNKEVDVKNSQPLPGALEKQLGLKLAAGDSPVRGYVIARASKPSRP